MKKLLVTILFLTLSIAANAQLFSKERIKNIENFDKQFLTWGYFLGFNSFDFNFDYNYEYNSIYEDILVKKSTGFNVGLIGDMRINEFINIRLEPGLYVTKRNLLYHPSYFTNLGMTYKDSDLEREVNSTYVHIPLLVKFSTKRINNFKPFIVGGFSTALNLSSNQDSPDDNFTGQFRTKKNTLYYELGFGIDFYLFWFKFTPSIRGVFSMNDELVKDDSINGSSPWTGNINSMETRAIFINFTFQ